ncbi:MAG TPA: kelch repeat-containing protein [Candidatus Sulfotelmatobacter sp.]
MNRSHLPLVTCLTVSFALAAAVFRASTPTSAMSASSSAGSLTPVSPMLEPRSGHSATLLPNGKVFIAGGMRRNQDFYKSAELYDPATGKFQPAGEMHERRVGHIAVLLPSGKVLIAGGWVGMGGTDSAELYDPAIGKFKVIGKMTVPRGRPSATLLANGDVLIASGEIRDNESLASAEIFHASSLTFQASGAMHHARIAHTATLLEDGRVLIAGGYSDSVLSGAELYDPKTGKFTETGNMAIPRCKHTAGLLPDGRVLIAGGSDERGWNGNLNAAEIYDPRTGKFTAAASLNDKRFKLPDEAVQLPSGKLLIAGGSKEVEVFDPASGKFLVASGQMSDSWHYLSETKLRDGSVLLAGGYPNNPDATAQAWIYRP